MSVYAQTDTTIYTIVEQMPEYPNGQAALFKYLAQNIRYPLYPKENGMEPRMSVSFIVEKDGFLSNIQCELGCKNHSEKEKKAFLEIFEKMPCWKAGMQNGKTIRVLYSIPVRIRLE